MLEFNILAFFCFLHLTFAQDLVRCSGEDYLGRLGSGIITSPNYPLTYQTGLRCNYRIFIPDPIPDVTFKLCFNFRRFKMYVAAGDTTVGDCPGTYLEFPDLEFGRVKYCKRGTWDRGRIIHKMATLFSPELCWNDVRTNFEILFESTQEPVDKGFYGTFQLYANNIPINGSLAEALALSQVVQPVVNQSLVCNNPTNCTSYCFHGSKPDHAGCPTCDCLPATVAPCDGGNDTCFNRKCIESRELCDGKNDCLDNSDEDFFHGKCLGKQSILACDFKEDECGFTVDFLWRRGNYSQHGPRFDHTTGRLRGGYFFYADYTFSGPTNLIARLSYNRTDIPRIAAPRCLQFYYFMSGPVGWLRVHINSTQDDINGVKRPVWLRYGNQGTSWKQALIELPPQYLDITQITFETEKLSTSSAEGISLDDFSVVEKSCSGDELSCYFELGMCGWTHDDTADTRWTLHRGATDSIDTGPIDDVGGNGHYIYLESSRLTHNSSARLVSPPVSNGYNDYKCLHFYAHMYGETVNKLNVWVMDYKGELQLVWTRTGNRGNSWREEIVPLRITGPFQIIFEAFVGSNHKSDIAIDHIDIFDSGCSYPTTPAPSTTMGPPPTCNPNQFQCSDLSCIQDEFRCDSRADCTDRSDELNCNYEVPVGSVLGLIIGALIILVIVIIAVIFVSRRRKQRRPRRNPLAEVYYGNPRFSDPTESSVISNPLHVTEAMAAPHYEDVVIQPISTTTGIEPPPPYQEDGPTVTISLRYPRAYYKKEKSTDCDLR